MMSGGWIKLYRKFLEWEWFTDAKMVQLFIYLLLSASIEQRKWKGIVLERGQLATTYPELAEKTNLSVQNLRTALSRLENSQIISRQVTNKYTLITICNFDSYQAKEEPEQQTTNSQTTGNQQTTNSQTTGTIAEEGKEGVKREEDVTTTTTTILVNTISGAGASAREKLNFYELPKEQQEAERFEFYSIFYWANYRDPGKQVEKFIKKNQGLGWRSKDGKVVFDTPAQRLALASMWVDADPTMRDRDTELGVLRKIYGALKKVRPDLARYCMDDYNGCEWSKVFSKTVILHYREPLLTYLSEDEQGRAIVRQAIRSDLDFEFSKMKMPRNKF